MSPNTGDSVMTPDKEQAKFVNGDADHQDAEGMEEMLDDEGLEYRIDEVPPFYLCLLLGFQVRNFTYAAVSL